MTVIVEIDMDAMAFEHDPDGKEPALLTLSMYDKDGQSHELAFEGRAIQQLAELIRAIGAKFPGALGVQ